MDHEELRAQNIDIVTRFITAGIASDERFAIWDPNAVFYLPLQDLVFKGREAIMERYAVRDRNHWHTVKESMYAELIRKHGSMDAVGHREMSWRIRQLRLQTA